MWILLFQTRRNMKSASFPNVELSKLFHGILESCDDSGLLDRYELLWRIEKDRTRFMRQKELLNDGTLGPDQCSEGVTVRQAVEVSKLRQLAVVLFKLVEWRKPDVLVEFGTNLGVSTAWQAVALQNNGFGEIHTYEASTYRCRFAQDWIHSLGISNITFHNVKFDQAIKEGLPGWQTMQFAFIDGNHHFEATLSYFRELSKRASSRAVFVFDDIRWSNGMKRAWEIIKAADNIYCHVEFAGMGIVILK